MSTPPPIRSGTPNRDIGTPLENEPPSWLQVLYECEVFCNVDGTFEFTVEGGSDNGEFPFFGHVYHDRFKNIAQGDILLDIQGHKVAGYTQRDVVSWLAHCARNGNYVNIKAVKSGYLTKDLRQYLNARFQKGSVDHDLQNTIRDNLYLRTVPCTTRHPRCGEINGVDYTFLSIEEFIALERSGNLLESGIYEGNLYGTPRPAPAASAFSASVPNSHSSAWSQAKGNHSGLAKAVNDGNGLHSPTARSSSMLLPGAHASSEGKRRRNRSNVEAMASKTSDISDYSSLNHAFTRSSTPVSSLSNPYQCNFPQSPNLLLHEQDNNETPNTNYMGNSYYMNNSPMSHRVDPRLMRTHANNFCDNDLPFGWERIDDPHYGTYYIDHVNRRTQYENPVLHLHANSFEHNASKEFSCRSLSWRSKSEPRSSDHSRSSCIQSPCSDSKVSPRTSRNSSLSQTTLRDSLTPANTNSESPLIDNNSSSLPHTLAATSSSNVITSSPAATHRFPYLHCIPCFSEKPDPKHCLPASDTPKTTDAVLIPNSNLTATTTTDATYKTPHNGNCILTPGMHMLNSVGQFCDPSSRKHRLSSPTATSNTIPKHAAFFTSKPEELKGTFLRIPLLKTSRGLGFTIIGGDNPSTQEFLQIKDVVPYGPAWCDGKLQTGDVMVYVNNTCVLGYSHKDIVSLFQSIPPGNAVHLEVCRGYPLPFDPNDPNNEIVTTVAVSVASAKNFGSSNIYSTSQPHSTSKLMTTAHPIRAEPSSRTTKSMPDLSGMRQTAAYYYPNNVSTMPLDNTSEKNSMEQLSVGIVKGVAGFGFTIADSSFGQKVKKILDRPRCKQLQESDILTEINGVDVQNRPHTEVVQILKDCLCGDEAQISVQRGHFSLGQRNKGKPKMRTPDSTMSRHSTNAEDPFFQGRKSRESLPSNKKEEKPFNNYRSKTPTAELYSSRDKDPVVVPRPKTPLVDTRNWSKSSPSTPASRSYETDQRFNPAFDHFNQQDGSLGDFRNGAELDRETTDYLLSEPNHKVQNRMQNRTDWNDQNFNSFTYLDDSNNFLNGNNDFFATPSDRFTQNDQRKESQFSNNEENYLGDLRGDSKLSKLENSIDWDYPFHKTNDNQRPGVSTNVNNNAYYNSHGPESTSMLNNHNQSQFDFTFADPTVDSGSLLNPYPQLSPKFNGNVSEEFHNKRHTNIYETGHQKPVNGQDHLLEYSKPSNNPVDLKDSYINMLVTLYRQDSGFGFRILGGTEEGSQACVGHIVPSGAADLDGRLQSGDEILGVDGQSVLGTSHRFVIELMNNASSNGKVTLHLRRRVVSNGVTNQRNLNACYEVTVNRKENEGFGFVLISSLSRKGSTIGRIIEGSPAERCGQLNIGDVIEAVNGISILNMHHGEIVGLIKDCGTSITLSINHVPDTASSITSVSQKGDESIMDPDESYFSIELQRGTKGFGFSIRGGREFHNMPLFVLRIAENGPAAQDARIQVNDQIVEINSVSTKNMTHAEAIDLIREGGHTVRLLVKRNLYANGGFFSAPSHQQSFHMTPQLLNGPLQSSATD